MNDDSAAELFIALGIPEKWVARIDQAARERAKIELVTNFNIWCGDTNLAVEMADYEREMFAEFGRDLLNYYALKAACVPVPVTEQNVTHPDLRVP